MNQIDKYLMRVHNLFENYQDECLTILKKYKPKSEVKKYTASVHNYIMSIAEPEDLKFYKDSKIKKNVRRPRAKINFLTISCFHPRATAKKITNNNFVSGR